MRSCKSCGGELPKNKRADALFCDRKCKKRDENKRYYVPKMPAMYVHPPCDHCGGVIPEDKKEGAKYCCKEHKVLAAYERRRPLEVKRGRLRYHADVEAARAKGRRMYHLHKEKRVDARREYFQNKPEIRRLQSKNRRGRKYGNHGYVRVCERDWIRLCNSYNNRCAYCGAEGPLQMDHVVPLSRGGRHAIANILPACVPCNGSKHNLFLVEWRRRLAQQ